jgi:hypothetical protein
MRPISAETRAGWLRREDRQILFVWLFFVLVLGLSALIGSGLAGALRPAPAPQATGSRPATDDALYAGSILFVARDGENCRQRVFDNQTGQLRDNGVVACEAMTPNNLPGRYVPGGRTEAIRKGFIGAK